jgi:hypothetical protein
MVTRDALTSCDQVLLHVVKAANVQRDAANACEKPKRRSRVALRGDKRSMYRYRLRRILDATRRAQAAGRAQRVVWRTMSRAAACNPNRIPGHDFVE